MEVHVSGLWKCTVLGCQTALPDTATLTWIHTAAYSVALLRGGGGLRDTWMAAAQVQGSAVSELVIIADVTDVAFDSCYGTYDVTCTRGPRQSGAVLTTFACMVHVVVGNRIGCAGGLSAVAPM